MESELVHFFSDGFKLQGALFEPSEGSDPSWPLVLVCSGFMGLRNIHPERFARALTARGFTCFGFDYRGFGPSEGTPGAVLLEEQIRDILHAVHFLEAAGHLDGRKLVLGGWGMGAGLILRAARQVPPDILAGLIALNGFYDAVRVQKEVRGAEGWRAFREWLTRARREQIAREEIRWCDPFDIYPLDPVTREYVDGVLRKNPDFGGEVHLAFAASLLEMAVDVQMRGESLGDGFSDIPLLIAHGDRNALHPVTEAKVLAETYPGPCSTWWIEGGGHTEWMLDDHPLFQSLVEHLDSWIRAL